MFGAETKVSFLQHGGRCQARHPADFDLEHVDHVRQAIARYRSTPAEFADLLIGLVNEADGCAHTFTFDRSLKRIPQFKVL